MIQYLLTGKVHATVFINYSGLIVYVIRHRLITTQYLTGDITGLVTSRNTFSGHASDDK